MNRKKKALKYVLTAVLLIVFIHIISYIYVESNNFSRKIDFIGSFTDFKFSALFILAFILFAISLVPHDIYFSQFKLFKGGIFKRIFFGPLQHQIVHFVISTIAGFIIAKVSIKFKD